ncbi:hypothetical protein H6G33_37540 [Calothrix sp. FACHB-1219]|uniref:hypothetical protein n=1 Tax=unclassified Calothrix TaxID=2619626 RepID=UPI0016875117|nr:MULTISPECIES: hypothetical protein [unclassified Calothrix]MBD2208107.1 hypothetical protein [Calothrix sp. FACHB-168]MBD2222633.1 hypothetical protein [Calothrix sp. FACHB-1219]
MNYISDLTVDSITFTPSTTHAGIVDIDAPEGLRPLQAFFWAISWNNLVFFANCVADGIGCGFEVANTQYDDDLEPDEEQFEGVCVNSQMDDESIVLSRHAFEELALRFLDLCISIAQEQDQPIQHQPAWSKLLEYRDRLKARQQ